MKEREADLRSSLELTTNIAQRINDENRTLRKKNEELKSQYKAQENDRELLVKQLVLQKKENLKIIEDIKTKKAFLEKAENDRDEEDIDLNKLDEDIVKKTNVTNTKTAAPTV